MDIDRMRILERVLVDVEREGRRFDMRVWRRGHRSCGTVCCAGGWLASDPEAQQTGLLLDDSGMPVFGEDLGFIALSRWLDVETETALVLFSDSDYGVPGGEVTTQMVLDRVRRVVVEGEECLL